MTAWLDQSIEERALLNPAFCASLIWHFASAGGGEGRRALTFAECFLVLPFVLHKNTREALPRTTRTSLAVWIDENSSLQATFATRTRVMVSFTKNALIFAGTRQFLQISAEAVVANEEWKKRANSFLRRSSPETQACLKKAAFLGSWFTETGVANTVMALLGVRP